MRKIYFSPDESPECGSALAGSESGMYCKFWQEELSVVTANGTSSLLNKVWSELIFIPKCTNMNVWQARTVINNICKQYYFVLITCITLNHYWWNCQSKQVGVFFVLPPCSYNPDFFSCWHFINVIVYEEIIKPQVTPHNTMTFSWGIALSSLVSSVKKFGGENSGSRK